MRQTLLVLLLSGFVFPAFGAVERRSLDMKLPSQQMIEKQSINDAAVAAAGAVLDDHAGPTSAAALTISSGFTQPDVPRVVSITPAGTTGDVEACTVTVTGTNIYNQTITDTFAFLANASTATVGVKAFKSITSAAFPASCESGAFAATWDIDTTDKLGMNKCLNLAGHVVFTVFDGAFETTRASVVVDVDEVEKNTVDPNGTLNDAKDVEVYFFQNFRCKP